MFISLVDISLNEIHTLRISDHLPVGLRKVA